MPYAVVLSMDQEGDAAIRPIWKEFADTGISPFLHSSGSYPHITLAVYSDLDIPSFLDRLRTFTESVSPFDTMFHSWGLFHGEPGTFYLSPLVTQDLLKLHADFHEHFHDLRSVADGYYLPGCWAPHCTVAMEVTPVDVPEAIAVCQKFALPIRVRFSGIGVVEFRPVKPIFSYDFKNDNSR